ncbi:hypothetical protein [Mesorhizobium sp. BR-1-1-10]|uniref:hypothetical protein n=1 Tax=Mesorhizobium sp. BR-1-1-10 TaxID=2876660 RepID=UPI001CD0ABCD|nr:hypothetical protein [Mesorhizobium sp. BR-1-1-10]MBZ9979202.1 hypothetical protein [Mesorhizobium sp. BR-1-1-10]
MTKLIDIVGRLSEYDNGDEDEDMAYTIYASEPWTEDSDAMVAIAPEDALVPAKAAKAGLTYFIEIFIAIEFTEAWVASLEEKPSLSAICQRLIEYATNDA